MCTFARALVIITAVALPWAIVNGRAQAAVYAWKDANGVMTFSDDPRQAPPGVPVEVKPYGRFAADTAVTARPAAQISQGEFALRLVIELGLAGPDTDAERAATILTQARIAPPLGRWLTAEPLTRDLRERLRRLTASAAAAGRIPLAPDQALYAFDTASDLLGVTLSERPRETPPPAAPAAAPAAPVYIVPVVGSAPVVYERLIFVGGGCCADGLLFPGQVPVIKIDNRIINITKPVATVPPPAPPPAPLRLKAPTRGHYGYPSPHLRVGAPAARVGFSGGLGGGVGGVRVSAPGR